MEKPRWFTKFSRKYTLNMKIKLELFGASRDLSSKDYLEFNISVRKSFIELFSFKLNSK